MDWAVADWAALVTLILYCDPYESAGLGVYVTVALPAEKTPEPRPMQDAKSSVDACTLPVQGPGKACAVTVATVMGVVKVTAMVEPTATPVARSAGAVLRTPAQGGHVPPQSMPVS